MKKQKSQRQLYKEFMKSSRSEQLKNLIKRFNFRIVYCNGGGMTTMDLIKSVPTTSPHKRMSELRAYGFNITKAEKASNGLNYYRWRI